MLGITIKLGASKDQIVSTKTGHVFADRYEARNRVKRVQSYDMKDNPVKPVRHRPLGMHYEAAPDHSYLKACHAVVMEAAKRGYRKAA